MKIPFFQIRTEIATLPGVWQSTLGVARRQLAATQPFIQLSFHPGSQRSGRVSDQAPTFSRAASLVLADRWIRAPPPCPERLSRPDAGTRPPGPCCLWFQAPASPARPDPSRKSFGGHACEFLGKPSPRRPPQPLFPLTSSEVMQRQSEMSLKTLPFQLIPLGDCVQWNNSFVAPAELAMNCSLKNSQKNDNLTI